VNNSSNKTLRRIFSVNAPSSYLNPTILDALILNKDQDQLEDLQNKNKLYQGINLSDNSILSEESLIKLAVRSKKIIK